ncbi:UBX domain-containing protein 4 [Halocaridina rubra]|uniref:UBX domain-containing protein 4 n=1 Tax=Halocaridina rubra TaxID=373956 RepID=A0AAN9A013_HALRR
MKWFTGTIPDAIGLAKLTDAVFVVYVHDSSEASTSTDEVLADKDVSSVLSSKKFVAIKLENGSDSAKQFAQIYPVVVLPSLYFIKGSTGMPMEILGGPLTKDKLKEKLDLFNNVSTENSVQATSNNIEAQVSGSNSENMEVEEPQASCTAEATTAATSSADEAASRIVEETEAKPVESMITEEDDKEENSSVPLEERVARAKVLLAEKQAQKADDKAEDERRKEMERRKMGQEIAKRKRQQYEDEVHSAVRERKKEKDEDRAARERVRAQIAADRLEREKLEALLKGVAPSPAEETSASVAGPSAPASSSSNASVTRLKFRLPDGSSSIAQFSAEARLSEVRQHVENQLVSSTNFQLSSTVHHKPFTSDDNSTSLQELGLVPSAIIVVLTNARTSGSGSVVPSTGGIVQFLWLLLSPITFLFSFVRQLFSGTSSSRGGSTPPATSSRDAGPSTSQSSLQRPTSSYGRPRERRWQREGNIHRLQGSDDDEDDNNTWNGNSTQQM